MLRTAPEQLVILFMLVLVLCTSGCTGKFEGTIAIHNAANAPAWYVIQTGYQPEPFDTSDPIEEGAEWLAPGSTVLVPAASSYIYIGIDHYVDISSAEQQDTITIIAGSGDTWDEYTFAPIKDRFGVYIEWDGERLAIDEGIVKHVKKM